MYFRRKDDTVRHKFLPMIRCKSSNVYTIEVNPVLSGVEQRVDTDMKQSSGTCT